MSAPRPATGHDARSVPARLRHAIWRHAKAVRQRLLPRRVAQHVFVAGMQRSGTNLLMDVLDASAATQVFHETDPRAFERYEMRDCEVIGQLVRQSVAPVFVIKALCELDRLPFLMERFNPAKTLWMVRDWRDSVDSAIKSFGNFVPQWQRLAHGDASDWRGRGMSATTRERLRALYRPDASEAEGAAIMWFYRNAIFFEQQLAADPRVRVVFYESLVQQPMREVAAVYDFLGLSGFNAAIAARIHARSVRHRSPPDISPAVAGLCDELLMRFKALPREGSA
ncbi:sulfotransferase family protein [Thiobacillus sedimenti]|uniref:Sulfotransferase n=1 Tax=Thiobacillus sedimenti TaxID=3110231 RepID=A0ABZ1CJS9_9PROT|nr:sulfotransferase [Thiobacillus sp. SCUT-2]WRS39624.1 sulfotransferase [Thiobacillus sp. SCUT-2]